MPAFDELSSITYFPYGEWCAHFEDGVGAPRGADGCRKSAMGLLLYILITLLIAAASAGVTWWLVQQTMARQRDQQDEVTRQSLQRLRSLANRVAANVDEYTTRVEEISVALRAPEGKREEAVLASVSKLIEANRTMQVQLDSAEERLHAQARQIESQTVEARTDALTQVANRRAFDHEVTQCAAELARDGKPASLLLLDVDRFKKFNDAHGHQAGDEVLRQVARVLRHCTTETELVARYGGEEFAIIFRGAPLMAVRHTAERVRVAVAATAIRFEGKELHVSVSAGLAEFQSGEDEAMLIQRVDEALYASKKGGRNCIHWNDGAGNHLLKLDTPRKVQTGPPDDVAALLGDEWQCDTDNSPDSPYYEANALVAPRSAFLDDLIRRMSHFRRDGSPLALLLVQVDKLPQILESHSADSAGTVLRVVAQVINANMRDMDHVSRLSSDTFAMLLPGCRIGGGVQVASRLRHQIAACRLPRRAGIASMTATIGVVETVPGDDMRRLLQRARNALQVAVDRGRNQCFALDVNGTMEKEVPAEAG
jgi:diguanylate cyclase